MSTSRSCSVHFMRNSFSLSLELLVHLFFFCLSYIIFVNIPVVGHCGQSFFDHLFLFFQALNCWMYAFLPASESSSSVLSNYSLSMSSRRYKVFFTDINFLVIWSICLSSSIVQFKYVFYGYVPICTNVISFIAVTVCCYQSFWIRPI